MNAHMINKITKKEYSDIWDLIVDDIYCFDEKEHRRGSNFYTRCIFLIDEENFPNNKELHGFWISDTIIWDSEYGMNDDINILYRTEKHKVMVEIEEWKLVHD